VKKLFLFFILTFLLIGCSPTINQPLFSKSNNPKELIKSKYGEPSSVMLTNDGREIWEFDFRSPIKSNRTVIFDGNNSILENKKHYKVFHMVTGLNKSGYIFIGLLFGFYFINGPIKPIG
jgi:hypothetical protein